MFVVKIGEIIISKIVDVVRFVYKFLYYMVWFGKIKVLIIGNSKWFLKLLFWI